MFFWFCGTVRIYISLDSVALVDGRKLSSYMKLWGIGVTLELGGVYLVLFWSAIPTAHTPQSNLSFACRVSNPTVLQSCNSQALLI
jgi:hypothetical protein